MSASPRLGRTCAPSTQPSLATQAGTVKAVNVVMLGAVSQSLPFADTTWEQVIRRVVPPKTIDVNLKAFELGRAASV